MSTLTISYAQAMEDLHLAQTLADVPFERGFYIDVGANDPEIDSVTNTSMTVVGAVSISMPLQNGPRNSGHNARVM